MVSIADKNYKQFTKHLTLSFEFVENKSPFFVDARIYDLKPNTNYSYNLNIAEQEYPLAQSLKGVGQSTL